MITITKHALDKYMSITCCKNRSKGKKRLMEMFLMSEKVDIGEVYKVKRLINNNINEAEYYEYGNFRFVVVNDVIITFEEKFSRKR